MTDATVATHESVGSVVDAGVSTAEVQSMAQDAAAQETTEAHAEEQRKLVNADVAKLVAERLPFTSRATVNAVIATALKVIEDEFRAGSVINLKDFGKFELRHREERLARNPRNGDIVVVPEKTVPKFTFARKLKNAGSV